MNRAHLTKVLIALSASSLLVTACDDTATEPDSEDVTYERLVEDHMPVTPVEVDTAGLPTEDPNDPRQPVGVNAPLDRRVAFGLAAAPPKPTAVADGAIRAKQPGFVWSAELEADGAAALRVQLTDVFLPRNASLYVFTDRGEMLGPYTGRGPRGDGSFWTDALRGDTLRFQLRYDGVDTANVLAATRFVIADVGVLDDRFRLARYGNEQLNKAFCSFNESCVFNIECPESNAPAAVENARGGVALMLFGSGPFQYICSGGLIADTDDGSDVPYFLTANHCISKGNEASSLQTFFNFSTPCGGSCDMPSTVSTSGAEIVAGNRTSDYTLLRLSQAPAGATFLPFDNAPIANSDGAALYRVSHPGGAPQAYSAHEVDTSAGTCSSWPRGAWIYSRDTFGATEGGSSGSPVLNAAGEVVGQLSGGCGTNVNDECDAVNNATVDGALAAYYDDVAAFLDPNTTCTDGDGDGYCAETDDCNDADGGVNPGASEVCDDGVDNDCDGDIDSADSECGTGTCDLLPGGASCVDDSECCSSKCKGKPGSRTCR